jgi:hypothetical protein
MGHARDATPATYSLYSNEQLFPSTPGPASSGKEVEIFTTVLIPSVIQRVSSWRKPWILAVEMILVLMTIG